MADALTKSALRDSQFLVKKLKRAKRERFQKLKRLMDEYGHLESEHDRYGVQLRYFQVPPRVAEAVVSGSGLPEFKSRNHKDYLRKCTSLLWYEEFHQMIELRNHDLSDTTLKRTRTIPADSSGEHIQLSVTIPNLSKGTPSLVYGDNVIVKPLKSLETSSKQYRVMNASKSAGQVIIKNVLGREQLTLPYPDETRRQNHSSQMTKIDSGDRKVLAPQVGDYLTLSDKAIPKATRYKITAVQGDDILVGRPVPSSRTYPNLSDVLGSIKFDVYLFSSGIPFVRCHDALQNIESKSELRTLLSKPSNVERRGHPLIDTSNNPEYLADRLEALNGRQQIAVREILAARSRPFPYIIFSPPGTGKTATIVETIVQIHQRQPERLVLLCANSNARVRHLHEKLKETGAIDERCIKRFTSVDNSRDIGMANERYANNNYIDDLLDDYDSDTGKPIFVRTQSLSVTIIVTTNTSAARLQTEFDYIFLDEAGHTHVPEALIPWSKLKSGGCMVLAGDPHRFGPVVQSRIARRKGLDISVLKYFFTMRKYERVLGDYDRSFITKLNISYRCDPRLLAPSNELFYDNELECRGKTPPSLMRMLNLQSPIVLVNCDGRAERPEWSTSWRNRAEIAKCLEWLFKLYMMGIEPHQIGLVSFYGLQKDELMRALKDKIENTGTRGSIHDLNELFKWREDKVVKEDQAQNGVPNGHSSSGDDELAERFSSLQIDPSNGVATRRVVRTERVVHNIDWTCNAETVDAFQGEEREIMIISTVINSNSSSRELGFLNDRRRFNVTVSRAKWLVIIIGDLKVLEKTEHWRRFIKGVPRFS